MPQSTFDFKVNRRIANIKLILRSHNIQVKPVHHAGPNSKKNSTMLTPLGTGIIAFLLRTVKNIGCATTLPEKPYH